MCNKYIKEIPKLIIKASKLAGKPIKIQELEMIYQPLGHIPKSLPPGKMTVYTFVYNGEFLKIGQANVNSKARYQSHHYHVKSGKNTLANRLLVDSTMKKIIGSVPISDWIKANCERYDVLIDAKKHDKLTLNFIEGLLQYKYNPRYEG